MDKHESEQLVNELYDDLSELNNQEEEEELIGKTSYEAHQIDGNRQFYQGSIKITPKIQANAKTAIESRLRGVAGYHNERMSQLEENWQLYQSDYLGTDTLIQMFYPEIYNSCEDWIDDFVMIFSSFVDYLECSDLNADLETYISKSLKIEEPDLDQGVIQMLASLIKTFVGNEADRTTIYYFQKKDLIKAFMKWGVERSGFAENLEKFCEYGVIGGTFITKDEYTLKETDYQITFDKTGEGDDTVYNSVFNPKADPVYLFKPIDPRRIIIPKSTDIPWLAEEFDTTVSAILSDCTDENGKQKPGSKYDYKSVKKMIGWLKENRKDEKDDDDRSDKLDGELDADDNKISEQKWLDAQVKLLEIHWIPLMIPGKNKPVKTRMYAVNLSDDLEKAEIYLIGLEETPYTVGFPYDRTQFLTKDREWTGMGLPQRLRKLQDLLNSINNHYVDLMNIGLWGIMLLDPSKIENQTELSQIRERMIIKVKNSRGARVDDIVSWLHPPTENLQMAEGYLDRLIQIIKRTSRKGATGEKVAPDPTATEFTSMVEELKKAVNRSALRLNHHLVRWCHRMYKYYLLNYKTYFTFRAESYRLFGLKEDDFAMSMKVGVLNKIRDKYRATTKLVELTPRELIVEGMKFKCKAYESYQKEAVERQQTMQAVALSYSHGLIKNPDTGQPNVFIDEAGTPLIISEYKLIKKAMDSLDMGDVFIPASKQDNFESPVQGVEGVANAVPGATPSTPKTPDLTASPRTADILKQSANLGNMNVR